MQSDERFELLQKLLREINELRITDTPINELAFIWKESNAQVLDDVMNLIRKEM